MPLSVDYLGKTKTFHVIDVFINSCESISFSNFFPLNDYKSETLSNNLIEDDFKSLSLSQKTFNSSIDSQNNANSVPQIYVITSNTKLTISGPMLSKNSIKLSDIAGYESQINSLKDIINSPLIYSIKIEEMNVSLPKSVLIFGPSGTGKTMTIKALINEFSRDMNCVCVNCAMILSKSFGESDTKLRNLFSNAIEMAPSLIFLDNIDIICANKRNNSDQEKRLIATLIALLDDLPNDKHIVIIAATNKPDSLDNGLRRPGRLDREIEFNVPLPSERYAILRKHFSEGNCDIDDQNLSTLAHSAHGFTGADLVLAFRESALIAVKEDRKINFVDLEKALKFVRPSAMREISLEVPNVYWHDIGGMKEVRKKLEQSVVWPLKHPQAFKRIGIEAPRGVLMYGPPGCCKTMIGKALATESDLNFIAIKGPELFNKWVGESERAVREVFRKAKAASPSILFFDEIDALAAERGVAQSSVGDRVLAQILTEIDGIEKLKGVIIVAATNRPDMIDKALLRPGRLDSIIYVPLPDCETRLEIFKIRTRNMPLKFEPLREQTLKSFAEKTEGYTGAEISAVCQEAGLIALENDINSIEVDSSHFLSALESVKPRISQEMISFYESYKLKCNEIVKNERNK
jgi:AAA family ATPase